jgi:hypothetical protein
MVLCCIGPQHETRRPGPPAQILWEFSPLECARRSSLELVVGLLQEAPAAMHAGRAVVAAHRRRALAVSAHSRPPQLEQLMQLPLQPGGCRLGSFSLSEDCSLVVAPTTERSPSSVAPSAGMERSVKLFCELALERPPSERAGDGGSLSGELLLEDASRRGDAGQGASHCMIFVSAQNEKRYRFWTLCVNSILIHAPLLCTAQLRRPRSTAAQTALLFRRHRAI